MDFTFNLNSPLVGLGYIINELSLLLTSFKPATDVIERSSNNKFPNVVAVVSNEVVVTRNIKDMEESLLKTSKFLKSLQNNFKTDSIILDIFTNNNGLIFPNLKNSSIYYIQKLEIKNANDGWAVISLILERSKI